MFMDVNKTQSGGSLCLLTANTHREGGNVEDVDVCLASTTTKQRKRMYVDVKYKS